jgi:hypothetical protein
VLSVLKAPPAAGSSRAAAAAAAGSSKRAQAGGGGAAGAAAGAQEAAPGSRAAAAIAAAAASYAKHGKDAPMHRLGVLRVDVYTWTAPGRFHKCVFLSVRVCVCVCACLGVCVCRLRVCVSLSSWRGALLARQPGCCTRVLLQPQPAPTHAHSRTINTTQGDLSGPQRVACCHLGAAHPHQDQPVRPHARAQRAPAAGACARARLGPKGACVGRVCPSALGG